MTYGLTFIAIVIFLLVQAPDVCEEFVECLVALPCKTCLQITPGAATECTTEIADSSKCLVDPPPPTVAP